MVERLSVLFFFVQTMTPTVIDRAEGGSDEAAIREVNERACGGADACVAGVSKKGVDSRPGSIPNVMHPIRWRYR